MELFFGKKNNEKKEDRIEFFAAKIAGKESRVVYRNATTGQFVTFDNPADEPQVIRKNFYSKQRTAH